MSRIDKTCLTVALSVTAAITAGCGGSQSQLGAAGTLPQVATQRIPIAGHRGSDPSSPEILTASHVAIKARCVGSPHYSETCTANFKTQGTAGGPLSGRFVARGYWFEWILNRWSFRESFTISSGSSSLSGTISAGAERNPPYRMTFGPDPEFGPATLKYKVQNGGGRVKLESSREHALTKRYPTSATDADSASSDVDEGAVIADFAVQRHRFVSALGSPEHALRIVE